MNNINFNLNNNNLRFKAMPYEQAQVELSQQGVDTVQNVELPLIYQNSGLEPELTPLEKLKKVDVMGMVYPFIEHPILGTVVGLGLIKGVDAYAKACGGEYEKSILGKATSLGDKIAESKFWARKIPKAVLNGTEKGINGIKSLFSKSSVITAMKDTPARAEKMMAKSEIIPRDVRFLHDFNEITEMYFGEKSPGLLSIFKKPKEWVDIYDLGLDKAEKEVLKKQFNVKRLSQLSNSKEAANWALLKRLGDIPDDEINRIINSADANVQVKNKLLKALNLMDDIQAIKKNPEKYVEKVREVTQKVRGRIKIGKDHYKFLGPFQMFERAIGCDHVANRLHSTKLGIDGGARTKLGRFFANAMHKIHRGLTFGGGKFGMFVFIVPHFILGLSNVKKADKSEKVGTFAKGMVDPISWVFTFPAAIAATYALGGIQYAGMGKDKVDMLHNIIDKFNATEFADKATYDKARKSLEKRIKALRRVKNENIITKTLKGISKFFYQDLGKIKPFEGSNAIGNFVRKLPNKLRNIGFEPLRFILALFVLESFFRGLIEKGTKLVFGKYYDEEKEKEFESKKEEQKKFLKDDLHARLLDVQREKLYGPAVVATETVVNKVQGKDVYQEHLAEKMKASMSTSETDSIDVLKGNRIIDNQAEINKPVENTAVSEMKDEVVSPLINQSVEEKVKDDYTYIPKQNPFEKPKEKLVQDNYTYIPNSTPVQKKEIQNVKRDNYTYIPSTENIFKKDDKVNKYIPSQIGAKFTKTFDNSGLESALKRAERAEKKALQTLAGNFGSYE